MIPSNSHLQRCEEALRLRRARCVERGTRQENFELRRANEILKSASVFFAKELDPDRPR